MKCYLSALLWKSSVHLFNCSNSKKDKINLCSQMQSLKLCNTFFPTRFRKVCLNYFCKNISNSTENKETLKIAEGKLSELFLLRCDSVVLGGFQLLDLIIPELKSQVIPYKFKSSHCNALVEITTFRLESKSCKGFLFTNKFSTNERPWLFNKSCDF